MGTDMGHAWAASRPKWHVDRRMKILGHQIRLRVRHNHLSIRNGSLFAHHATILDIYYLLQWAQQALQWQQLEKDDEDDAQPQQLTDAVRTMIQDQQWLELNIALPHITASESRLASLILMLNSPFCKAFAAILNRLFQSLTSEHATVKSRGLKSIVMLSVNLTG